MSQELTQLTLEQHFFIFAAMYIQPVGYIVHISEIYVNAGRSWLNKHSELEWLANYATYYLCSSALYRVLRQAFTIETEICPLI